MCTLQDAANGLNGYKMGEKTLVVKMAGSRGPPPGQGCYFLALTWMHTPEIPKDCTDTCCALFALLHVLRMRLAGLAPSPGHRAAPASERYEIGIVLRKA